MSNLDPFTQKLLERTQARKEARNKLQENASRSPLKSLNNDPKLLDVEKPSNKRHSSEGFDSSFEKKPKQDKSEEPKKSAFSLKSTFAHLNEDFNERYDNDILEQQKQDEAEALRQQKNKERLKQQEEERTKRIQERIFGKDHVAKQVEKKTPLKQEHARQQRAPLPKQSIVSNLKKTATPMEVDKESVASVGDKKSIFESKMKEERLAREKEIETEKRLRHKKEAPAKHVVVGKSLPEKKPSPFENLPKPVIKETSASENEIKTPTKKRLPSSSKPIRKTPHKIPPQQRIEDVKISSDSTLASPAKSMTTSVNSMSSPAKNLQKSTASPSKAFKSGVPALAEDVAASPGRKSIKSGNLESRDDAFDALHKQLMDCDTPPKIKKLTITSGEGTPCDVNSPQPTDCTEDTCFSDNIPSSSNENSAESSISDSKAFDVSAILQVADNQANKRSTPHRSSTLKSQVNSSVPPPLLDDIDVTPVKFADIVEETFEEPSEFAKQLQLKKVAITKQKGERKLKGEEKKKNAAPEKPPRVSSQLPTYTEFGATKAEKEEMLSVSPAKKSTADDSYVKHKSPTKSRKKMRRSASFSAGQNSSPAKASGYNKQESSKFDALSNLDKPDREFSKRDKIQSLLEEAAYQQNIVLQTSQALNVAESSGDKRGSPEVIEGERLLLLATEKRTVCLEEVRQLKETPEEDEVVKDSSIQQPCNASLALTDIKLPLHPEFLAAIRNGKMDLGIFHFVVVVNCGSQNVFSTKAVSCFDATEGCSLTLNTNILLTNVSHNFTLTVRVFGLHTKKNNDPHSKLKKANSSSQSPGNLKNLFSKKHKEEDLSSQASPQTVFRTSNFKLVGETKITLDVLGTGGKYLLLKVPSNCPLDGMVHMRVGLKPAFTADATGFLTILEDVGGYTAWNRRWCKLSSNKISYWKYPDEMDTKEPIGSVDLRYCITKHVGLLSRDKCARPHTFELELKRGWQQGDEANLITSICGKNVYTKVWISTDNKEDRTVWMATVNKQLSDARAWLSRKSNNKSAGVPEKGKPISV